MRKWQEIPECKRCVRASPHTGTPSRVSAAGVGNQRALRPCRCPCLSWSWLAGGHIGFGLVTGVEVQRRLMDLPMADGGAHALGLGWWSSTQPASSPTPKPAPAANRPGSSRTSSTPSSSAASWPRASCGCAAANAAPTSCWPAAASCGAPVLYAARAGCRRRQRIGWTPSSRACRYGNGCCPCRSRCARCWLPSPKLVTPVLQRVQRVVTRHLLDAAGLEPDEGRGGAVTLIQRFGSAANLNIPLHCLVLDGVCRCGRSRRRPSPTASPSGRVPGRRC